ncbi:peptidoglycan DD-metalloendopeptidase family protein [Paraburkholderia sp. BCC1885]|uniref:peptidoglycan DD-metalloendopeptidase family protein n=1 Tax=Paraburkholderia sp. BCC1885 TaxID=2562669 RepID=UPI001182F748|nr:peptidoglycan DD-metalloendopeptidase family protein [Paraburkholderia sp. BCC1885]
MTEKSQRAASLFLITVSVAAALSGCTISPWGGDNSSSYNGASGSYQTNVPTGQVAAGYYRVNPGDTLPGIAAAYGQHPQDLARWNGLQPNASVSVGQVLRVAPPPVGTIPPAPPGGSVAQQGALNWPLRGPVLKSFIPGSSKGIVIGGRVGDPVKAAAAGRVVYAGSGIEAYGPLIIIKHSDSLITAYGQNSALLVKEGDAVTQGQVIGSVGADSRGVGSIQFEVRQDGHPVDPLTWLPRTGG